MEAYKNAIMKLSREKTRITAIDIGCARCAFLNEFLIKYYKRENIEILGIDPLQHNDIHDAAKYYNYYIKGCVDNIDRNTIQEKTFYINAIDQASSLLKIKTDNFTSDLNNLDNGFYYPQDIIDKLKIIVNEIKVKVYNINDIIHSTIGDTKIIDFIKIDAEGKDMDIVKSLKENFHRIKYISVECSCHKNEKLEIFENGSQLIDAITFFTENGFEVFEITDYSNDNNNLTQMSDVVFVNKLLL